jgi:hypothetical protein
VKRQPPVPHPLDLANRDAIARRFGLEPAKLTAWMEWREPAPRAIVERIVATYFPLVPPESFWVEDEEPLPSVENSGKLRREMQTDSPKRLGRPPTSHPFTRALALRGKTVAEWADDHGLKHPTVSSWFLGKNASRKIPMSVAQIIEKELGVPLDAWKNGIRYDLK